MKLGATIDGRKHHRVTLPKWHPRRLTNRILDNPNIQHWSICLAPFIAAGLFFSLVALGSQLWGYF